MLIKTVKQQSLIFLGLLSFSTVCNGQHSKQSSLSQYVDPYIGTGGHGHVFVGANVPYGMVQLGPNNISNGWDWVSGYHISDSTILGFAHQHLSGTGIGDLGDIALLPFTGNVVFARGNHDNQDSGAYSFFKRKTEKIEPGYYAVHLDRFGVDVELTTTKRVGFHHYTYPANETPKVLINLDAGTGWEGEKEGNLIVENDSTISGYRYSKGWAKNQKIYFTAKFSRPIISYRLADSTAIKDGKQITVTSAYGELIFAKSKTINDLLVKVALSPVSIENAKQNLSQELSDWNFERTKHEANQLWENQLNKIEIETNDIKHKKIFYTALYHTMIAPSLFSDVNGQYMGSDFKVHKLNQGDNYTIFPMWDTYRAGHPLMNIIHQERVPDMINSMLRIYQEQGKLPVWHLAANETDCMVGNPGINVVADAYLKGIDGFDKNLAYEAMKASAMKDDRGLNSYKKYGYVPFDEEEIESVAKGLEFGLADWSLAQVAKMRGEKKDYDYFLKRSKAYQHYFDKDLQFLRGKDSKGNWRQGKFDPFHSAHMAHDYTEGNAWQYTWLVPHDVNNFINLFGSDDKFITKLDSLFVVEGNLGGEASPDISGLIGQYAHGNEPSHHVIYLYNYAGQPYKAAKRIRETLNNLYTDAPDGLSGNEDVGQMSAWYILSSLGFYQVSPAGGPFVFGSPLFDQATIAVGKGKVLKIKANNNSEKNIYIQSIKLNGKSYLKSYISYEDIIKGGTLEFYMGATPSKTFGIDKKNRPFSTE
ncbi:MULTISPECIES: GH92 family glycosyl hydrolase [Sphingobacterium]|uniref:GH92 family glycosyl hydrolase n=1 Tax=Sphingobacterium TaxID=28453 RepID=UPI00104883A8|nr:MULTISPECIES: GH92 family glycosyl hydrolase [Sphingobacterium]MCW2263155.1 putative alpha-1,2-mannosidase [Sphingobacterium kitahiroshimense]TCR11861.1 putative alpha-1,2-mannosidase [Sphingobacterium sp. JUb78]